MRRITVYMYVNFSLIVVDMSRVEDRGCCVCVAALESTVVVDAAQLLVRPVFYRRAKKWPSPVYRVDTVNGAPVERRRVNWSTLLDPARLFARSSGGR